jgi:5-methylcytosine-specific restriction endonuclease McrA
MPSRVAAKTGELVSPTPRGAMTRKRRAELLLVFDGRCAKCGGKITEPGWVANHITPLAQGGPDTLGNLEPLHKACDGEVTPADLSRIAKTKRQAKLMEPREPPKRPIKSAGFDKRRTRHFDGKVTER